MADRPATVKREVSIPIGLYDIVCSEMEIQYVATFSEYVRKSLLQQTNRDKGARERAERDSKARRLGNAKEDA